MTLAGIILAAGKGTRMKSDLPKGLHPVCGLPMAAHVVRALEGAGVSKIVVVIGHGAKEMREALGDRVQYAVQSEQLGTGHAALMAKKILADFDGPVIAAAGDTPLITDESLRHLLQRHHDEGSAATAASFDLTDPSGYGRIVRDAKGNPTAIVEDKDLSAGQRGITEVNAGLYCFDCKTLMAILPELGNSNSQGEYYLTDVLQACSQKGLKTLCVKFADADQFRGVNDRWQLAEAGQLMNQRILKKHALNGVSIMDPGSTFISADSDIGGDTVIYPFTIIEGVTKVGRRCTLGPSTRLVNAEIGDDAAIQMSFINCAKLGHKIKCGPYAHIRPDSNLGDGVRIGNFVEVKKSDLGEGVNANHLSYIGDASVGEGTNIGAGTITCNYDGYRKHRTVVGKKAFVGSNSTLVAPVNIGEGAYIAAGSVITKDVSQDALGLGRAAQVEKEEWAVRWRQKNEDRH